MLADFDAAIGAAMPFVTQEKPDPTDWEKDQQEGDEEQPPAR
jgi:hypothetical protein